MKGELSFKWILVIAVALIMLCLLYKAYAIRLPVKAFECLTPEPFRSFIYKKCFMC